MRRLLPHVLPAGFHRIRQYGLLANPTRKKNIEVARALLHIPVPPVTGDPAPGTYRHRHFNQQCGYRPHWPRTQYSCINDTQHRPLSTPCRPEIAARYAILVDSAAAPTAARH
jgi:hypothetical protein